MHALNHSKLRPVKKEGRREEQEQEKVESK